MGHRTATLSVLQCDAPEGCPKIAGPALPKEVAPGYRTGRYMLVSGTREAIAAARAAGWARGPYPDFRWYCPAHTHHAPQD